MKTNQNRPDGTAPPEEVLKRLPSQIEIQALRRLEDSVRKNQALAFLLSSALFAGDDTESVSATKIELCGIRELSESISEELAARLEDVWEVVNSGKFASPAAA